MTEFVVSASFVLVPLFIIVPLLGKYVDMKLAAVQAARYTAWEYTAHYSNLNDQPDGFSAFSTSRIPQKPLAVVQREAERRFYSDTSIAISTSLDRSGYIAAERNPLWTYHTGLPMYSPAATSALAASGSNATPDKTAIFSGAIGIIGAATNFIASAYKSMGIKAGFDAINPDGNISIDGRYDVSLNLPVENAPNYLTMKSVTRQPLFGSDLNLVMEAKSSLLTENWGAGGVKHTIYQSQGLVPTKFIDAVLNGWGIPIQNIASTILLSPELADDSLIFGYMIGYEDASRGIHGPSDDEFVPVGKLENDTRSVDCPGGYCEQ